MMVGKEYSWIHARCHVALSVMLGAFRKLLVEDILQESYQTLSEVATAQSRPGCLAVFSDLHDIENEADVL